MDIREYVKKDIEKYDGISMPVKANIFEQIFIKNLPPKKLHPNPHDEFCMESIGPNDGIISDYMKKIRQNKEQSLRIFDEPVIVEKMKPDGYMLINGHHRWAAALSLDIQKIPVKVSNMTHVVDILEQIEKTNRTKRASINLDEVVFCRNESEPCEKPLVFPFNRIFPERIRKDIPALIYALQDEGYDVWVYSSGYSSMDYISQLFRHRQIHINGIINGADHSKSGNSEDMSKVKELMAKKYRITLNIDTDQVSWVRSDTKEFDQIDIQPDSGEWTKEVISIIRNLKDL